MGDLDAIQWGATHRGAPGAFPHGEVVDATHASTLGRTTHLGSDAMSRPPHGESIGRPENGRCGISPLNFGRFGADCEGIHPDGNGEQSMHRHRRVRGDRGATLVEASIVTPVLLLFVFAIFEFGFAFRDYLAVANTTRDGAREASVAGNVGDADYRILRAVRRASTALPDGAIDRIIIFKAAGPETSIDEAAYATCRGGTSVVGLCNVYTPTEYALDIAEFACDPTAPLPDPDRFWCPSDRQVSVTAGLDFVGVYVEVTHDYITGLFGDSITFRDATVLQVEPQDR
jgi:hypothetical protein